MAILGVQTMTDFGGLPSEYVAVLALLAALAGVVWKTRSAAIKAEVNDLQTRIGHLTEQISAERETHNQTVKDLNDDHTVAMKQLANNHQQERDQMIARNKELAANLSDDRDRLRSEINKAYQQLDALPDNASKLKAIDQKLDAITKISNEVHQHVTLLAEGT